MKGSAFIRVAGLLSVLSVVAGGSAVAQDRLPVHFSGLLNDYVPAGATSATSPLYEMHGTWTIDIDPWTGKADFSTDMTMANWATTTTPGSTPGSTITTVDPSQPGLTPHTHRITLTKELVAANSTNCPTYTTATYGGFQFTGTVSLITGNGSRLGVEPDPLASTLTVCVTGGQGDHSIPFSNITIQFVKESDGTASPATKHFGSQAIHGVVKSWNNNWDGLNRLGIHFDR